MKTVVLFITGLVLLLSLSVAVSASVPLYMDHVYANPTSATAGNVVQITFMLNDKGFGYSDVTCQVNGHSTSTPVLLGQVGDSYYYGCIYIVQDLSIDPAGLVNIRSYAVSAYDGLTYFGKGSLTIY